MSEANVKTETLEVQPETAPAAEQAPIVPGPGEDSPPESIPSGPDPEAEVRHLREQVARQKEEAARHQDLYLRERAELDNFKKRMARERAEALRFASEPLIRELLPVVDNLERALAHGEDNRLPILDGVRLVLKSLLDMLQRHGVTRIDAMGQPFDPSRHEAMVQVESDDHEPNHVVAQHQSGYLLHDRLLRPALVSVSRRKSKPTVESAQDRD
jgi:molecular chaperone GrpE